MPATIKQVQVLLVIVWAGARDNVPTRSICFDLYVLAQWSVCPCTDQGQIKEEVKKSELSCGLGQVQSRVVADIEAVICLCILVFGHIYIFVILLLGGW